MYGTRYLAEAFLNESLEHKLPEATRKELESLGFRELNDGSFMINPTKKMSDTISVEKEGTGLLVRWSVKNKHDYREITTAEVGKFVKSIIEKFGAAKIPSKIQEAEDVTEKVQGQRAKMNELEDQFTKECSEAGLVSQSPRLQTLYINGKSVTVNFKLEQFKTVIVSIHVKDVKYKLFDLVKTDSLQVTEVGKFVKKLKDAGKKLQATIETLEDL